MALWKRKDKKKPEEEKGQIQEPQSYEKQRLNLLKEKEERSIYSQYRKGTDKSNKNSHKKYKKD